MVKVNEYFDEFKVYRLDFKKHTCDCVVRSERASTIELGARI